MSPRKRRQLMRTVIFAVVIAGAAALVAPHEALGKRGDDPLSVRFNAPVSFSEATPECPQGTATFGISADGKTGSGTNCLLDLAPAECPTGVEALFCQELPLQMVLRVPGGTIRADVMLFEIWNCGGANCSTLVVDQRWPGDVVDAKGRFGKLDGATVSGGGTIVFDAATFDLVSLDEVIDVGQ